MGALRAVHVVLTATPPRVAAVAGWRMPGRTCGWRQHTPHMVCAAPSPRSVLLQATALLVLCATVAGAYAADNDKAPLPPKKLLSAADKAFRKKDFGTALNYYAQLLAVEPSAKHYYKVCEDNRGCGRGHR